MSTIIRHTLTVSLLACLASPGLHAEVSPVPPALGERIEAFQSQRPAPDARQKAIMEQAAAELAAAMPEPGLKPGSEAPDFNLPDAFGKTVRLTELLESGPVILTFYRGAWCPYCNLQLHALNESLPLFRKHGAQLVAVTPQTPDRSRGQIEKDAYPFHVLSDLDNRVMQAYNLYFEVPEALRMLYIEDFDLDIAEYNGEGRYGLPVPGTFVIDTQGIVRAAFADTDYRKRMEPAEIIRALTEIGSKASTQ